MSEQTTSEQKALPPETAAKPQPSSAFGGRTDGSVGLDLGLAPTSFATNTQHADEAAPESLGAPRGSVVVQQRNVPVPPPKEHPFRKRMREAAEKLAAEKAAKETPAQPAPQSNAQERSETGSPDVQDAEFVEKTA